MEKYRSARNPTEQLFIKTLIIAAGHLMEFSRRDVQNVTMMTTENAESLCHPAIERD